MKNFLILLAIMAGFVGLMWLCYSYGQAHKPNVPIDQTWGCRLCYPGFECSRCKH